MPKKVTLERVARAAGVSAATASRVLGGRAAEFRIPGATADGVLAAAQRLGYSLNRRFFKPETLRSRTIGLIVPDLSHYFLGKLARTVVARAHGAGFTVLVCDSMEDTAIERRLIDQLAARDLDGLLLLPVGREWGHVQELTRRKLPLVLIDRVRPDVVNQSVCVDNRRAAFDATEHLIAQGHRRIACIQRLPGAWINDERVRGFREAHAAHGLRLDEALVVGDQFGGRNGYLEVKRLLAREPRPTAILALSVLVTLEALRALRDQGMSVPQDLSLVGFDDLPNTEFFAQPITTVRQPIEEMARMAIDLLLDQIERRTSDKPMAIQLPCELVRRQSVRSIRRTGKIQAP